MATIGVPLLVCIVGALLVAFVPKGARLGEIAFFVGLFWLVYLLSGKSVHLF